MERDIDTYRQGGQTLSKKDRMTFHMIQNFREGSLSRSEAAFKLGCTERTITRRAIPLPAQSYTAETIAFIRRMKSEGFLAFL